MLSETESKAAAIKTNINLPLLIFLLQSGRKHTLARTTVLYIVNQSVLSMEAPLTFSLFLASLVTCSLMSVIAYKYQQTISPGSQNIINKLNFFLVINLTLINASQGVLVIWRSAIGPLDWGVAEIIRLVLPTDLIINTSCGFFRHIFFSSIFLLILTANAISIIRLLIVLQVM